MDLWDLLLFPMSYEYSEEPFLFLNSSTTTLPYYSTSLLLYSIILILYKGKI